MFKLSMNRDSSDPVKILRTFQTQLMYGWQLNLTSSDTTIEGETVPISVDQKLRVESPPANFLRSGGTTTVLFYRLARLFLRVGIVLPDWEAVYSMQFPVFSSPLVVVLEQWGWIQSK